MTTIQPGDQPRNQDSQSQGTNPQDTSNNNPLTCGDTPGGQRGLDSRANGDRGGSLYRDPPGPAPSTRRVNPQRRTTPDRLAVLDTIALDKGDHDDIGSGACVMEVVSYVAGEPWTDTPDCASPVIGAFLRARNDHLADKPRQTLKQYIPRLVGSRGTPDQEDERAWLALDWLVRTYTPVWFRLAGLDAQADSMAGLPELQGGMDVPSIRPAIDAVRKDADAARAATGAAAWETTWDAAWETAWDAARAGGWPAAWAAAREAAGDATGDAAREIAWDAAWAGGGAAARAAAWAGGGAWLQPAVDELQLAAHQLVDRMLEVTGS